MRGVSGGERKRVSLAEMALAGPPIAAWDNSTRGLDSQTALEFVRSLRIAADVAGLTSLIAICEYMISLHENDAIYVGPCHQSNIILRFMTDSI